MPATADTSTVVIRYREAAIMIKASNVPLVGLVS